MARGIPFKRGNKYGKGGRREESGRPPDWLKQKCQDLIERHSLIEFLADVAEGKSVERYVDEDGGVHKVPASVKDRLRAIEMLTERGWGKPPQDLNVGASPGSKVVVICDGVYQPNGNGNGNGHSPSAI